MSRLTNHLNSDYVELASRLRPKSAKRRIVAYVESFDDVYFWRSVLQDFETDHLQFEIMLPSRKSLCKGKKAALMNRLGPALGNYMIACVDADYDYLMQGITEVSHTLLSSPHVLHTYAYAIENYQCYAPSLHTACVMSTLNDREVLDLAAFMEQYSLVIWPLFVWSVWAHRNGKADEYTLSDMGRTIIFHDINPQHPEHAIELLRTRVNKQIGWLQHKFPNSKSSYLKLRQSLQDDLGINPKETYLYIQGHMLKEGVVLPLLTPICNMLRREREREIGRYAVHTTQKHNELSSYQRSQSPIELMLRKGIAFKQSVPYTMLKADIERLVKRVSDAANPASPT